MISGAARERRRTQEATADGAGVAERNLSRFPRQRQQHLRGRGSIEQQQQHRRREQQQQRWTANDARRAAVL